ncbi:hypothetical protein EK904_000188 [Melospiza melodia maxima]|nr:hypothetical protein EK904_000188 [Melospiza melodia maxima]
MKQSVYRALLSCTTGVFQSANSFSLRVKQAPAAVQEQHNALGLLQGCDSSSTGSHHPGETSPNSQAGQSWNCQDTDRDLELIGENSQPLAVSLSRLQSEEPWHERLQPNMKHNLMVSTSLF